LAASLSRTRSVSSWSSSGARPARTSKTTPLFAFALHEAQLQKLMQRAHKVSSLILEQAGQLGERVLLAALNRR